MAETDDEELEVTPQMKEAGREAFAGFHPDFEELGDRLAEVYRAMEEARHASMRPTSPRENRHDESSDQSPSEVDKRRDDALRRALTTPPKPHKESARPKPDAVAPDGTKDSEGAPVDYSAPPRPARS